VVNRDGVPHLHLTSTKFFAPITDEAFLATREVWEQEVVSENAEVYRAEYLAARMLAAVEARGETAAVAARSTDERLALVQEFAASRYDEGYTKGVHDLDGARIFDALIVTTTSCCNLRATIRPHAPAPWCSGTASAPPTSSGHSGQRNSRASANATASSPATPCSTTTSRPCARSSRPSSRRRKLYPATVAAAAGEYLFHELSGGDTFVVSREADEPSPRFNSTSQAKAAKKRWRARALHSRRTRAANWTSCAILCAASCAAAPRRRTIREEVAALVFCGGDFSRASCRRRPRRRSRPEGRARRRARGALRLRLRRVSPGNSRTTTPTVAPRFTQFQQLKRALIERERAQLRLEEFKPRVLSSFVRNQLIDQVYLPLVGDNLAKQIGAAGAAKRTDLMGLLLLISPPGYGKTTLLEYVASRLGIVFVKINGPALGHAVTSLDPEARPMPPRARNLHRLNLALRWATT
jgi:hypothetical protein